MDKYALRRSALKRLVDGFGHGGISRVAAKIGKEPSYVSRMLYADEKPGRKRIGEDSAELLSREFPGWLDEAVCTEQQHTSYPLHQPGPLLVVDEAYKGAPYTAHADNKHLLDATAGSLGFTATPNCESALAALNSTLERITPILRDAGKSALLKWLNGEVSAHEAAAALQALTQASETIGSATHGD